MNQRDSWLMRTVGLMRNSAAAGEGQTGGSFM